MIPEELLPDDDWFRHIEIDFNMRKGHFTFAYRNMNSTIEIKDETLIPEWELYDPIILKLNSIGVKDFSKSKLYTDANKMKKDFDYKWEKRKVEILKLAHNILVAEAKKYIEEYKELTEKIKNISNNEK